MVTGLAGHSARVQPGDLFVASPSARGAGDDGLAHLQEALSRGAVGVLAERRPELPEGVAFVGVPSVAAAKPLVASTFYRHPSRRLAVVGITGTNGKTTVSWMLRSMLSMDGRSSGLIGTLGAQLGETHVPLANTTPDALELQALLARMVDENLSTAVMEVSSHALALGRTDGIDFDVGVFTNLSRDHLDFHGDMERYGDAKALLFEGLSSDAHAVLNADDPFSAALSERTAAQVTRFGLEHDADVSATLQRLDTDGAAFRLRAAAHALDVPCDLRMVGRHNVSNALAAASAALALGLPPAALRTGLAALQSVPGRLQPIHCGQDFRVLVDYAHTPDALEKVLELLRPLTRGRLHVVFGCGGDRDRSKRPLMGAAVARWADRLYVTSDNPRSEPPEVILDEILEGVPSGTRSRCAVLSDRRAAIDAACRAAESGDVVLLAGKGHETTQTIGDQVLPFDDREVAKEVLWTL
ncbi:MAG: UDP-N-acetylmuramoyl-L-alanyl-D-glutamate--2,6-diaminopimelate ligase [Planctomycetota bacterium]|nr:MAG: UDP-N-acetylmuramoyl-L-alanyl-D-glutamate--2,6-diaminopimelate ligase [Planctomycetota bacterium]